MSDDLRLLGSGAVHLFWSRAVLDDWCSRLEMLGYNLQSTDCSDQDQMCLQMSEVLQWQEQFGYSPWTGNLDAFNDGMRGFPFGPSGKSALILHEFDGFEKRDKRSALAMLDIIEYQARNLLLQGNRLLALVHTNDPSFDSPPIGGRAAQWNPDEWSQSARGL